MLTAVITYNSAKWIEACLESVLAPDFEGQRVVVIDNASTDDTVGRIRAACPNVEVIRNRRNLGFGQACNRALVVALGIGSRYCFLLNADTVVDRACLRRLVEVADRHCDYFAVSPLQFDYEGNDLDPMFAGSLEGRWDCGTDLAGVVAVEKIIGAAMLLRVESLRQVGGFDPLYFVYGEEIDLFRRARYMGLKLGVVPCASIRHWHRAVANARKGAFIYQRYLSSYICPLKDPCLSMIQRSARYARRLRVDLGAVRRKTNKFALVDFVRAQCFLLRNCWRIHRNACQDRVPGAMRYL